MARKKKTKKVTKTDIEQVNLIERIPSENVNLKDLADFIELNLQEIHADRQMWETRRAEYYDDIDNFVHYYARSDLPFDSASSVHVPVTLEKLRAIHARFFQALFGVKPPFWVEPQEALDEGRINKIYNLMRWALSRYMNYYKGIKPAADEFLWNFCAEGWSVCHLTWERKVRKALIVEEEPIKEKDIAEYLDNPTGFKVKFKEVQKWIENFAGPVLRTIQNEDVFMPGKGTVQDAPLIAFGASWSGHDLRYHSESKYFDPKAVKVALDKPDSVWGTTLDTNDIDSVKSVNQGYDINADSNKPKDKDGLTKEYRGFVGYCTYDIDGDGFDEELMFWYHPQSKQILRWTYLDRITRTGRRPVYKSDFILRPGRSYALGLMELLHPLSVEVDAMHNQRIDYGTISNMPFFFYSSLSNNPNQRIKLMPGEGIPMEDPKNNVYFPTISSRTGWGFQEETLLFQIINRISAISDLNLGIAPDNAAAVRSQGQMLAVLQEGNAQLDIPLRRLQEMFGEIYKDIHQMLIDFLPRDFKHVVLGEDDTVQRDPQSQAVVEQSFQNPRREIAGHVHFNIQANSTAGSKALMRQNRLQLFQFLMNPMALQMGITTANEVYEMHQALLDVSEEVNTKRFVNKPQNAPKPLSLAEELSSIQQGVSPEIPINDDHQRKAQAIAAWMKDPSTIEAMQNKIISPNALLAGAKTLEKHQQMLDMIGAMSQMYQNTTGSQTSSGTAGPQNNLNINTIQPNE